MKLEDFNDKRLVSTVYKDGELTLVFGYDLCLIVKANENGGLHFFTEKITRSAVQVPLAEADTVGSR